MKIRVSPAAFVAIGAVASAASLRLYSRVDPSCIVFGWVGLVPWLSALDRTRSWRGAAGAGLAMSVLFTLAIFPWFASAIAAYTGASVGVAFAVLTALGPWLQPQFVCLALARRAARELGLGSIRVALVSSGAYVGAEWAMPKLFGDTLGHGLYASVWMRQGADLAGAAGLTFVMLLGNECALTACRRLARTGSRRGLRQALAPAALGLGLAASLAAYGAVRLRGLESQRRLAREVTVGVVQADLAGYRQLRSRLGSFEAVRRILDAHFALSERIAEGGGADFLVWPETVYPTTFGSPKSPTGASFDRAIESFVEQLGVPLVFGSYDADGRSEFNAAMFLEPEPDGRLALEVYRKASLFPLTEHVPRLLDLPIVRRMLPWMGTWKAGRGPAVLSLDLSGGRRLRVGPLICYDAVRPGHALAAVRRGAQVIVTLSNDSWFEKSEGVRLSLLVSMFRSIETRRPQVRATNTGISAVISPSGRLLRSTGIDKRTVLVAPVPIGPPADTLMLAWGDWLGPTVLTASLVLLAAGGLRRRRPFLSPRVPGRSAPVDRGAGPG